MIEVQYKVKTFEEETLVKNIENIRLEMNNKWLIVDIIWIVSKIIINQSAEEFSDNSDTIFLFPSTAVNNKSEICVYTESQPPYYKRCPHSEETPQGDAEVMLNKSNTQIHCFLPHSWKI